MLRWVEGLARRQAGRLPGARASLDPRPADGTPRASDEAERPLRVLSALVARRQSIVYTTWNDEKLGTVRVVPPTRRRGPRRHAASRATTSSRRSRPTARRSSTARPARLPAPGALVDASPASTSMPRERRQADADHARRARCRSSARRTTASTSSTVEDEGRQRALLLDRARRQRRAARTSSPRFATEFAHLARRKWLACTENVQRATSRRSCAPARASRSARRRRRLPVATVTRDAGEYLHWSGDVEAPALGARPGALLARAQGRLRVPRRRAGEAARGAGARHRHRLHAPMRRAAGSVALTGARIVITMRGDEVIEDGTVVVDGNRIAAVGANVQRSRRARRSIDVRRQDDHARPHRRALARLDGRRRDHPAAELGATTRPWPSA